jgi:hypothetical protein
MVRRVAPHPDRDLHQESSVAMTDKAHSSESGGSRCEDTAMVFGRSLQRVLHEVETVLGRADRTSATALIRELLTAKSVYAAGAGRSGLAWRPSPCG